MVHIRHTSSSSKILLLLRVTTVIKLRGGDIGGTRERSLNCQQQRVTRARAREWRNMALINQLINSQASY